VNHRQRVLSALARQGYDRIPVRHFAEPEVNEMLMDYFDLDTQLELEECLGADIRYVWPDYVGPEPRTFPDGSYEIPWPWRWSAGERYRKIQVGGKPYDEVCYRPFESITDPNDLSDCVFPTTEWLDFSTIKSKCARWSDYVRVAGYGNVINFICGLSHSLGVERALVGFATEDPVLLALMDIKFDFHYNEIERVLQAAEGGIEIVHIGEDLGTQRSLLISPHSFDKYIAPYFAKFFDMVHHYGAKVMMHSCGSVRKLIPRLIDLGLDILDVVQVSCDGMDIRELHREYGDHLCFCGSMDVQGFMVTGTPQDIEREVKLRQELFRDGGLILGPSHTIEPDVPVENILAMYRTAGSLACEPPVRRRPRKRRSAHQVWYSEE
jgi:uroporphyrinogen decarboxylase